MFNADEWVYVPDAMGRLGQGHYKKIEDETQTLSVAQYQQRQQNQTSTQKNATQSGTAPVSGGATTQLTPWDNPVVGEQRAQQAVTAAPSDTGASQTASTSAQAQKTEEEVKPQPKAKPEEKGDGGRDSTSSGSQAESASAKVICSELHRQGRMTARDRLICLKYAEQRLGPDFMTGYHFWAVPYVRLMRRSDGASGFILPFVNARTQEVKKRMGQAVSGSFWGKVICAIHDPICCGLGRWVKPRSYHGLYPSS